MTLRWLRRKLKRYSPSAALRWMYRRGVRQGLKRGIERGKQSVPPILNRCMIHNMPTYSRLIPVADGRWIEMWCCPMLDDHTKLYPAQAMQQFTDYEAHTDKLASTTTQQLRGQGLRTIHQAIQNGRSPHTAVSQAIPKPKGK